MAIGRLKHRMVVCRVQEGGARPPFHSSKATKEERRAMAVEQEHLTLTVGRCHRQAHVMVGSVEDPPSQAQLPDQIHR